MIELNPLGQPIGPSVGEWRPPLPPPRSPLAGQYCRLEPLVPARHAAELFAAYRLEPTGGLWTYMTYGPFETLDNYADWLNANCLGDDPLFFAIIDGQTGQAAGVASYLRIAPASGSIEVGHLLFSPALQRSPAATEAMWLMMRQAFVLGYRRFEWKCDALNAKSRAAALRLGLSFEGIFRQATVYKGRNRDTAWFAAIDTEFPRLEDAFTRWLNPANFDAHGRQRLHLSDLTEPIVNQRGPVQTNVPAPNSSTVN